MKTAGTSIQDVRRKDVRGWFLAIIAILPLTAGCSTTGVSASSVRAGLLCDFAGEIWTAWLL